MALSHVTVAVHPVCHPWQRRPLRQSYESTFSITHRPFLLHAKANMVYHDKPDDLAGEEFELPHDDNAPLLPRYDGPSSETTKPKSKYARGGPRRRRPFLWICVMLAIMIPSVGFTACYYERKSGRTLNYDGLPDKAKQWIDKVWGPHTGPPVDVDIEHFPTE